MHLQSHALVQPFACRNINKAAARHGQLRRSSSCFRWSAGAARVPTHTRRPAAAVALCQAGSKVSSGSSNSNGSSGNVPGVAARLLSCLLFTLPLAEGTYRLLLVAVRCCWQCVLDLWAWCLMQQDSLQCSLRDGSCAGAAHAAEELQACGHVAAACHHLFLSLQATHQQLAVLNQHALLALPRVPPWLPEPVTLTPAMLWDAGSALAMLLVLQLAITQQGDHAPAAHTDERRGAKVAGSQLVVVSFWCTVLLRVAWAPLCSISGTLPELYSACAALLTSSTAFLCVAAIGKVLFNRRDDVRGHLRELAEGTQGVVLWHRALVYLDWLLSMVAHGSGGHKLLLTAKFICYAVAVDMCNSALHVQLATCR